MMLSCWTVNGNDEKQNDPNRWRYACLTRKDIDKFRGIVGAHDDDSETRKDDVCDKDLKAGLLEKGLAGVAEL